MIYFKITKVPYRAVLKFTGVDTKVPYRAVLKFTGVDCIRVDKNNKNWGSKVNTTNLIFYPYAKDSETHNKL